MHACIGNIRQAIEKRSLIMEKKADIGLFTKLQPYHLIELPSPKKKRLRRLWRCLHFSRGYLTPATICIASVTFLIHLRFLRNIRPSFWQTYSKPTPSKALTSSGFSTTLCMHNSLSVNTQKNITQKNIIHDTTHDRFNERVELQIQINRFRERMRENG